MQDTDTYPLKGLLCCGVCGRKMTSSNPKSRGKKYFQYECGNSKCRKTRIYTDKARDQFKSLLEKAKPSERVLKLFDHLVFDDWDKTIDTAKNQIEEIEKRILSYKQELRDISSSNKKGIYTDDYAKEEADRVRQEMIVLQVERGDIKIQKYDTEIVRNFTIHFLENLYALWNRVDLPKKQVLQAEIYPKGIYCDGTSSNAKLRINEFSPSFQLIEDLRNENYQNVTPPEFESGLPG